MQRTLSLPNARKTASEIIDSKFYWRIWRSFDATFFMRIIDRLDWAFKNGLLPRLATRPTFLNWRSPKALKTSRHPNNRPPGLTKPPDF
ncbi:hypothetical protein VNO80_18787 [Phaseolus coccineus]|uniref:Uncharacterized protein n=1 Tax=Phaseolus coccineus TaxID=3886 RepID=A0AAN9MF01_PHACN